MGIRLPNDHDPMSTRKTVTEFEQWAHEHGCTLHPAFERCNRDLIDGNGEGWGNDIRLPLLYLAVYDGETVRAVYPHTDGDTVNTIHDGIDALESMVLGNDHPEKRIERNDDSSSSLIGRHVRLRTVLSAGFSVVFADRSSVLYKDSQPTQSATNR